jgi:hypothetical protein
VLVPGPLFGVLPDPVLKNAVHALQEVHRGFRTRSVAIQGEGFLEQEGIVPPASNTTHRNQGSLVGSGQSGGGTHGESRTVEEGDVDSGQAAHLQVAYEAENLSALQYFQ